MSESLRNDGRVWVPQRAGDGRAAADIPEAERDYYLERKYPSFGNLVPRDVASRNAKAVCDEGKGVGATGQAVYLDFRDAIERDGKDTIEARYGNLFEMYERITAEDPYSVPMRIFPAVHYTMGGLWVDYNLESTIPGLFVLGEAKLLRPRREPPRCERAHARSRRRLLRGAGHDREPPRRSPAARRGREPRRLRRSRGGRARAVRPPARRSAGRARSTASTASSA